MASAGEVSHEIKFDGGLNLVDPATEIADNELLLCENFWYPNRTLSKRPGFFKLTTSAFPTLGLVNLGWNPLSFKYLVMTPNANTLWEMDSSGVINTVAGPTNHASWMIHVNGVVYVGFDGAMGIRTLAAGVLSGATVVNSPQSQTAAWHKNRIFTDVLGVPGRLAFSAPNAPGTWLATPTTLVDSGTIDIGVDDKEPITAIVSLGDLLLVFKHNSCYSVYVQGLSSDWVIRRIAHVGAPPSFGGASAYYYNGIVYFISKMGVFKTNGTSFDKISEKVWVDFDNKYNFFANFLNGHWRITRYKEHLLIFGKATGRPAYNYAYNLDTGAWSNWTFLGGLFDDIFVSKISTSTEDAPMIGFKDDHAYIGSGYTYTDYLALAAINYFVYKDGSAYATGAGGSAFISTFRSKKFTVATDKFLRLKWAGLEYIASGSPTFQWLMDGINSSSYSPGFHATLLRGYKIPGGGRGRSFCLQGDHGLFSPYEFYRATFHTVGKEHIRASGAP